MAGQSVGPGGNHGTVGPAVQNGHNGAAGPGTQNGAAPAGGTAPWRRAARPAIARLARRRRSGRRATQPGVAPPDGTPLSIVPAWNA